jgi:hypothetical protein
MEQSGRNQWQPVAHAPGRRPRNQAKSVAVSCDRLPKGAHGKGAPPPRREGVASLAPQEAPSPANPKAHGT